MKLITWNVNGIRAAYKKGLDDFIRNESPDVLCLQEVKAHPEQLTEEQRYPHTYDSHWVTAEKKGYSGVATYFQTDITDVIGGLGKKEFDNEGRVLVTDHHLFLLYNIYFPNGQRDDIRREYKMHFHQTLLKELKQRIEEGREIIVVGDYNLAPEEKDIYDPVRFKNTSGFLPEERKWFKDFIALGFIDTFRHFYPNDKHRYSWWSMREGARSGNRGWRIDHICVTQGLKKYLVSAEIYDHIHGSDHCPVALTINVKE